MKHSFLKCGLCCKKRILLGWKIVLGICHTEISLWKFILFNLRKIVKYIDIWISKLIDKNQTAFHILVGINECGGYTWNLEQYYEIFFENITEVRKLGFTTNRKKK